MNVRPATLLELSQAVMPPSRLDDSALVIIDAQLEYFSGKLPLSGLGRALAEIALLLAVARRRKLPVLHVVQRSAPGRGIFDESGEFVEIFPELAPRAGEIVIAKRLPNAFAHTELERSLRALPRSELVLCGFMTHMCVSATARAALDLGFRATVVASATATRALPDPLGGVLSAEVVQRCALAAIADRFAAVAPSAASVIERAVERAS